MAKEARYQVRYYDRKHKLVGFKPGDLIWLNASHIVPPFQETRFEATWSV